MKQIRLRIMSLYFLGIISFILGIRGEEVAVFLSKPANETSWFTSKSLIDTFTYIPIIVGVSLLGVAIFFTFSVLMKRVKPTI